MSTPADIDAQLKVLRERNLQKEADFALKIEELRKQLDVMSQDAQALASEEQQLARQFGEDQHTPTEGAASNAAAFASNVVAGVLEGGDDRSK